MEGHGEGRSDQREEPMRRFALLILVVLVGVGGYLWYRGDAPALLTDVKNYLFPKKDAGEGLVPGGARIDESGLEPVVAILPCREALTRLANAQEPDIQIQGWTELTSAYLDNQPGVREVIVPELSRFVSTYVLSRRLPSDKRIAERINVREGDVLARLASHHGTTIEAIKRFNDLATDTIRPGLTLKVLNQPVAIFVDKTKCLLWATYGKKFLCQMPCGVGLENRTPKGTFTIAERIANPDWFPANKKSVPAGDQENALGSRWLGFKDTAQYSGLGIHEAKNREDVGKPSSNGCIRLIKEDIELLFDVVPLGTLVTITE
jgi:lipoprotein-anchoring transpeptidase ErfK/SrfK